MSTSKDLIAEQAKRILGLLPDEDRVLVEAHIEDRVSGQNTVKVKWAAITHSFTLLGVVVVICVFIVGAGYLIILDSTENRARCEGWCAKTTETYTYVHGGGIGIPESCTCSAPSDPTRVWKP
jgi:hypothetical protein